MVHFRSESNIYKNFNLVLTLLLVFEIENEYVRLYELLFEIRFHWFHIVIQS